VPEKVPVLVVSEPEDNTVSYIRYALNPAESTRTLMAPVSIVYKELAKRTLDDFRAVIFLNVASLTESDKNMLRLYYRNGGSLVFFLGDRIELRSYNDFFKSMGIGQIISLQGTPGQKESFVTFTSFQNEHPIFKDFFNNQHLVNAPRIYAHYQMVVPAATQRLISFSNNDPALLEADNGKGKLLVFPFAIDLPASNFALKASFVPLIYRMAQYLATDLSGENNRTIVGSIYTKKISSLQKAENIVCRNPLGEVYNLPRPQGAKEPFMTFGETEQPGIYIISAQGKMVDEFAVNTDPRESDISLITTAEVEKKLPGTPLHYITLNDKVAASILENRYGREVFGEVLGLVGILLFCEMFIARKRKYLKEESKN
jgi:hypothetical protein